MTIRHFWQIFDNDFVKIEEEEHFFWRKPWKTLKTSRNFWGREKNAEFVDLIKRARAKETLRSEKESRDTRH